MGGVGGVLLRNLKTVCAIVVKKDHVLEIIIL